MDLNQNVTNTDVLDTVSQQQTPIDAEYSNSKLVPINSRADLIIKDDPQVQVTAPDPFFRYKLIKQICLVCVYICMGIAAEMSGPTLPDLMDRMGVDYEEISRALAGKSVGALIGSVVGGFLNEKYYKHMDLFLTVSLALIALACYIIPWSTTVLMAAFAWGINGFAEGIINTGANPMVMHMWKEKAASPMHSLHFGFGLGALLAPQIARPFLSPDDNDTQTETYLTNRFPMIDSINDNFAANGTTPHTIHEEEDLSRIEIPYSIAGTVCLAFAFVVLFFYIKGPPKGFPIRVNNTKFREMVSLGSCTNGYKLYGAGLLTCLFFYFIQAVGGERAYGKFLFSFAIDSEVNMSKDEASLLQSAFWLSFTTGRLLGIPLAKWINLDIIIICDIIGAIVTSVVLAIYAYDTATILWVFTCFMGFFIAMVFPNGMSWANLRMDMNSVAVMVLMVGGSTGGIIYQYMTGYLFENEGPQTLMYVMVLYAVALMVSYVAMMIVAGICKPQNDDCENEDIVLD